MYPLKTIEPEIKQANTHIVKKPSHLLKSYLKEKDGIRDDIFNEETYHKYRKPSPESESVLSELSFEFK